MFVMRRIPFGSTDTLRCPLGGETGVEMEISMSWALVLARPDERAAGPKANAEAFLGVPLSVSLTCQQDGARIANQL